MSASIFPPESNANVPTDDNAFEPLPSGPTELRQFLKTAIRITSTLAQLHASDTIHRNIRPKNIRIHPPSGFVKLTGQAGAYAVPDPQREAAEAADALPYMSPEQTEEMKRPVDHRSDLYSLGVVLYEHLSGKRPFHAEDPMGWVQAHLTLEPPPLTVVAPETPQAVSDIVTKLLEKTVEERYQSARGLLLDLEACLVELRVKGKIEPFPLGARDVWHGLRISAKLYGRENEVVSLFASFERVVNSAKPEIALVSGFSGIGKTSVVLALHKPIVRERGFFLSGKFDQHKKNIPYITIGQAFRDLIRQILTERTSQLELWKSRISEALGQNAQLMIEIIPQLEELIGKQPPAPPLPVQEAQVRFNMTFRSFLHVFAKREHPLVLFLDDLQYADWASLDLLRDVMTHGDTKNLLVLGAYRDNEVSASHPAIITLEDIKKGGVEFTSIVLKPLDIEHLSHLVADTFHCSTTQARPLAALLHKKTAGNPFFANQFLAELHHENLVRFDVDNSTWQWDAAEIEGKEFTDDVVELMASKLRRLPGETQAALQLAACIGSEFDVEMLQLTHDKTPEETYQDLDPAVRGEFMLRRGHIYKFMHDRVHQAAYSLIPQEQVNWVHLRIGRLLLERTAAAERDDRVFDIVNQFNIGRVYITEPEEQQQIAELNLLAGKKAKASAAYRSAATYLNSGIGMLPPHSWDTDYKLAFDLHVDLAESEFVSGNDEETKRLVNVLLESSKSNVDKATAYGILMALYLKRFNIGDCLTTGLEALKLFGIELSASPTEEEVTAEFARVRGLVGDRPVEDLINVPPMSDALTTAAVNTLSSVSKPAYYVSPALYNLTVGKVVGLSIEHGTTPATAWGYVAFGTALGTKFGEFEHGWRFGKLAFDLIEKHNFIATKAEVCNLLASFISIWVKPLSTNIEYSRIGVRAGNAAGNPTFAGYNYLQVVMAMLVKGEPLAEVYRETVAAMDYIVNSKLAFIDAIVLSVQQLVRSMRGQTESLASFTGAGVDEAEFEARVASLPAPIINFIYHVWRLKGRLLARDYAAALATADSIKEKGLLATAPNQIMAPEYFYYSALAIAAGALSSKDATDDARKERRAAIEESREKLRAWSESCAENYLAKYLLVSAEAARLDGNDADAARLYDEAIAAARSSGFTQNEGLGNELAASFHQERDAGRAASYIAAARDCYARWGASAKVDQLEALYPQIRQDAAAPR